MVQTLAKSCPRLRGKWHEVPKGERLGDAEFCEMFPLSFAYAQQLPHEWWRLLVQCKHGVQCRTPRGAIVSMGLRGSPGGLRGEIEIFPGPLAKKDYKVAYSSLFNSLSLAYGSTPPSTGRLWGAFYQLFPCNSALPRRYAGKLLPSSHFHDIFES